MQENSASTMMMKYDLLNMIPICIYGFQENDTMSCACLD